MNPEIATDGAPQPRPPMDVSRFQSVPPVYIDLSFLRPGEEIVNIQTYRVETKVPRRWRFWTKEVIKFNFGVLTNANRFFIIDPDNLTVQEKPNEY